MHACLCQKFHVSNDKPIIAWVARPSAIPPRPVYENIHNSLKLDSRVSIFCLQLCIQPACGKLAVRIIGASLSEPHSYVESSAVVHARRTATKNGIATHYCSLGTVVHVRTNTINLRILPYKCIVIQKYSA